MNKKTAIKSTIITALLGAAVLTGSPVRADDHKIEIEITGLEVNDNIYTPYYQAKTVLDHEQGASKKWVELRVEYTTRGGWIDKLDVVQSALVNEDGDADKAFVLDARVSYINIAPGDHYAVVYMHPNLVERYQADSSSVDTAAAFIIEGKKMAAKETTTHAKEGWSPESGALIHKGHLLDHSETPFWLINYDFKEIIKHARHMH